MQFFRSDSNEIVKPNECLWKTTYDSMELLYDDVWHLFFTRRWDKCTYKTHTEDDDDDAWI